MNFRQILAIIALAPVVTACGVVANVRDEIGKNEVVARRNQDAIGKFVEVPRFKEVRGAMLPVTEVTSTSQGGTWLRDKFVESIEVKNPTPLNQVLATLAQQGINISSDLPLDNVRFSGKITQTTAEAALRQILSSTGLDYVADDGRKLVIIKPLASRTWYLNIGRRSSWLGTGGQTEGSGGGNSYGGQTGQQGQQQSGMATGGSQQGMQAGGLGGQQQSSQISSTSNMQSGANGANSSSSTSISNSEDFWGGLDKELNSRLNVPVPVSRQQAQAFGGTPTTPFSIPGMAMPNVPNQLVPAQASPNTDAQSGDLFARKRIGYHSLNPDTGAITVTAPYWVLNDLDTYIKRIQKTYNTELIFEGEVVLVNSIKMNSESIDLQHLAKWANGRYGAVVANNSLVGVTLSFPNGNIPSAAAGSQSVGGPLLGIISRPDGLQIFNDYLAEMSRFSVKETPTVATTHGVPGVFNTLQPKIYNTVTQQVAVGNTGGAVAGIQNIPQTKEFGTKLAVYPQYNVGTEIVRAIIDLKTIIYAGDYSLPQQLATGNSIQEVRSTIPQEKKFFVNGEVLLRDGDLIIVGRQASDVLQTDENGLPIGEAPLGGIFGKKQSNKSSGMYYFALKVTVKKRL